MRVVLCILDGWGSGIDNEYNAINFISDLKSKNGTCHIVGLISDGGVHSHQKHISILANKISQQGINVVTHAFLDGRDTPPNSAKKCIQEFQNEIEDRSFSKPIYGEEYLEEVQASNTEYLDAFEELSSYSTTKLSSEIEFRKGSNKIATISGRYYAMDRDNRWERTIEAYKSIAFAEAPRYDDVMSYIDENYGNNVTDEFIKPSVIGDYQGIKPEDGVLLANFRADRMMQLANILLGKTNYAKVAKFSAILSMMQYSTDLEIPYLFSPISFPQTLGQIVSDQGFKQLRIAETEKYAHVTFFFNCGKEEPFSGEERILIPSPKVKTYDLQPEMSALPLTETLLEKIYSQEFALIVVNYANPDMVGHTGNIKAAEQAVLTVDTCLTRIMEAIQEEGNTALIITSDHGNVECIFDEENQVPHTAHTLNKVPFIICSNSHINLNLKDGTLSNIAPTILQLLSLKKPDEMTDSLLIV
ncbi:Alkaline-phosphatase-like, core domain,BPG-independent PGAM, N- [Cinara cedri]|uniref:phosphoglycerate mutase (2,3-diphosphoglycerate-independent) n=1 Tax=Cinara cedri TaxID=506608 RepID=A0A5E4NDF7_9HEMI|nr:Alkaline-phosphatase-like, core domain,BPG-independent PGAM, N- [Cinara cedri]